MTASPSLRWLRLLPLAMAVRGSRAYTVRPSRAVRMRAAAAPPADVFGEAARAANVECAALRVQEFGGVRGVAAAENLPAAARVIAVPSSEALQVTSTQPCPSWAVESVWKRATWDTRLALSLLHADPSNSRAADVSAARRLWFGLLPRSFDTPFFWSAAKLSCLGYPPLEGAVEKQRAEWERQYEQLVQATKAASAEDKLQLPSKQRFFWALSCVRSRAFSGPYSSGSLKTATQQLAFGVALAGTYVLSGAGSIEQAANGLLAIVISIIASDFFFARFSPAKRYVLCPWMDLLNHHSSQAASQLSYEYFTDKFAATLDPRSAPVKRGEQVLISYGPRGNDQLLQYYGFVEADNPYDTFALSQEAFLIALNEAAPYEPTLLRRLKEYKLSKPDAQITFSRSGADELAVQLARVLYAEAEELVDAGRSACANLDVDLRVLRALSDVADANRAVLSAPPGTPPSKRALQDLVSAFRSEKANILADAATVMRKCADESATAGRLVPLPTGTRLNDRNELPGLGLTRIK